MNEKIAIGLIGVVLSVLLVIQVADVFAQQMVTNSSIKLHFKYYRVKYYCVKFNEYYCYQECI